MWCCRWDTAKRRVVERSGLRALRTARCPRARRCDGQDRPPGAAPAACAYADFSEARDRLP
eukprot:1020514-Pyramimonas_sp.AAC.1